MKFLFRIAPKTIFSSNFIVFLAFLLFFSANSFAAKIVSSIKPIDSLVRMIVGEKNGNGVDLSLVVTGNKSPHGFELKPSDIKNIKDADILFYVDDSLEGFLSKIDLNSGKKVSLLRQSDLRLFALRSEDSLESKKVNLSYNNIDPHVWLDTKNAKEMLQTIKQEIVKIDPENAAFYEANYEKSFGSISDLYSRIEDKLKDQKGKKFLMFHDAFQYFEEQFDLSSAGSITNNPHLNISLKSLKINKIKANNQDIKCVFSEPQFDSRFSQMVAKGTNAKILTIDADGFNMEPSSELYIKLMENIAESFVSCLS